MTFYAEKHWHDAPPGLYEKDYEEAVAGNKDSIRSNVSVVFFNSY
jgi:hypothetical protein